MNTQNHTSAMDDKAVLTDLLSSQKFVTGAYNTFCCEAAEPTVRNCLLSVLEDEHRIQAELFNTMNQKGFYTVKKAEQTKLNAAKQQFAN
jgi:spore coat protein CotF